MLSAYNGLAPGPQLRHSENLTPPQVNPRQSRRFTLRKLPKEVFYPDSTYGNHIATGFHALEMMHI
jgi:hypothetical protein